MPQVELKSPEDVGRYVRELSRRRVQDDPRVKAWRIAKRVAWLFLLVTGFLVYYLLDLTNEALTLPNVNFNVIMPAAKTGWLLLSSGYV